MGQVITFTVEARVAVREQADPAAVGAAVTTALCGGWEHEGPCRWPHSNAITGANFRTVVVADEDERDDITERITTALREGDSWRATEIRRADVAPADRGLAGRLLAGPRRLP